MKAGNPSVSSEKLICVTFSAINRPTTTNAGVVAKEGIMVMIGEKNNSSKKKQPVVMAVRPVRPPLVTPEALSTKVVTVEVPKIEMCIRDSYKI